LLSSCSRTIAADWFIRAGGGTTIAAHVVPVVAFLNVSATTILVADTISAILPTTDRAATIAVDGVPIITLLDTRHSEAIATDGFELATFIAAVTCDEVTVVALFAHVEYLVPACGHGTIVAAGPDERQRCGRVTGLVRV
jgi:hypothetical protein